MEKVIFQVFFFTKQTHLSYILRKSSFLKIFPMYFFYKILIFSNLKQT